MNNVLDNNRMTAVLVGGAFMVLAAVLVQRVKELHPATGAAATAPET